MPNYTQGNARTRPPTMHVFRGEKYRCYPGGPTQRKPTERSISYGPLFCTWNPHEVKQSESVRKDSNPGGIEIGRAHV